MHPHVIEHLPRSLKLSTVVQRDDKLGEYHGACTTQPHPRQHEQRRHRSAGKNDIATILVARTEFQLRLFSHCQHAKRRRHVVGAQARLHQGAVRDSRRRDA
jgi:hypothetical protein